MLVRQYKKRVVEGHTVEIPNKPSLAVYMPEEYKQMKEDGSFKQLGLETEVLHRPVAKKSGKKETAPTDDANGSNDDAGAGSDDANGE